jgi:hypothetical protein
LAPPGEREERPARLVAAGLFALTYSAELRAERKGRSGSVVDADPSATSAFTAGAARSAIEPGSGGWAGRRRRIEGKALSVLRLAKASATFAGGAIISPGRSTATPARNRAQAVAAALAAARRDQPAAAAPEVGAVR